MKIRFFELGRATETTARCAGEQIALRIEGLAPHTRYTVRATRIFQGAPFSSALVTETDADGSIATESARPLDGTYTAPDADGLFWSMRRASSGAEAVTDAEIVFRVEHDGAPVGGARLGLHAVPPGVRALPVGSEHGLVATLYLPADPEVAGRRVPAVITLGGSEGGSEGAMASAGALAHHGLAALALTYFGAPGVPAMLRDIPLEYFERALRFLEGHAAIRPDRIGVLGRSRGGELALLLGATRPELAAVIALVPSPYRWCSTAGPVAAAWTERGVALPYLAALEPMRMIALTDPPRQAIATTPAFHRVLDGANEQLAAARLPIERTTGPILVAGGDDDLVWPSARFAEITMQLARHPGRDSTRDECFTYPDAGHAATAIPGEPTTESASFHPGVGMWFARGGTPEDNARAQRDAWHRVLAFCHRHLA